MPEDSKVMLAGLGHELRNHFGVMQNALYLLRTRLSDADAGVRRPLDIIEAEVAAARALAEDILDLHRPVQANPVTGDVAAWVRDAAEAAVPATAAARLRLPDGVVRGRANPVLLARMVRNLVLNAVEAMGPGGGDITVSVMREGDDVVIQVADSGPGLPPGHESAVFEPFHTQKPGGTGLGLALVRAFASAQGGTVAAANRPEGGAVFTIRLPGEGVP